MGHKLFLAGGDRSRSVGVVLSKNFLQQIQNISFHAYSSRVCGLHFALAGVTIRAFACYFPTAWASDDVVEELYELLNVLMAGCVPDGEVPLLGTSTLALGSCLDLMMLTSLGEMDTVAGTIVESLWCNGSNNMACEYSIGWVHQFSPQTVGRVNSRWMGTKLKLISWWLIYDCNLYVRGTILR